MEVILRKPSVTVQIRQKGFKSKTFSVRNTSIDEMTELIVKAIENRNIEKIIHESK